MRGNNRKSIASIGELPQLTTMNVIDGQAGIVRYSSLIFYSLTIDNILNIIVLLILAAVSVATLTSENGILTQANYAKEKTEITEVKEEVELSLESYVIKYHTKETNLQEHFIEDLKLDESKMTNYKTAKAIAFWYKNYLFVVDENEMQIKCMGKGIVKEEEHAILYHDLLEEGKYVLEVKAGFNWTKRFWIDEEEYKNNLKILVVDEGVHKFNSVQAFQNCTNLENIYLPETMETIETASFSGCTSLRNVILPNGLTSLGGAFVNCTALESISLPDSLMTISEAAFGQCTNLDNVILPKNITKLETKLFQYDASLSKVVLPENLVEISYAAFQFCYNIESIYLPKSVKVIRENAFQMEKLKKVYYGGTETDWNDIEIDNGANNQFLINATKYYYSEQPPQEKGNYWHYVNGEIVEY